MNGFGAQLNSMQNSHSPLGHYGPMSNGGVKEHKKTLLQQQHDDRVKRPMKFVFCNF